MATLSKLHLDRARLRVMTTKASILRSIRKKCLDCSVYQPAEVRKCTAYTCDLHPYRFGRDPSPTKGIGFGKRPASASGSKDNVVTGGTVVLAPADGGASS